MKKILRPAILFVVAFTIICGVIYTGVVTGIANLCFNHQANGSIIEVDGVKYGSELLGQYFKDDNHMWGRAMNVSTTSFVNYDGKTLMYAGPSNTSPASDDYGKLIKERVAKIKAANPDMGDTKVPVDLVTCSGSGLDPDISVAAANYQVKRLAKANNMSEQQIKDIIKKCTNEPFLGVIGERTVNVLKVNLMIDNILK
ncbi:potassium-transporting ATPase subunit KdpC [Intestinibacter sp.]|uniref:potassium-transporting ATPase subunit KdpC n=1 Tax=Intestinibacter sp. TaxID=1965304 RepID=UPI002A761BD2|nr:potassium-transporting ATPase subunit KdpC [Intestinibacter sp.]MDY2737946.1 potassium-transporting ATPase subunit KdpC [Intestinibacter sp.]